MDEIEIWESLLKWCFAQQNMKNDPTQWSKEDITKIERSLHKFIPLIRICEMPSKDYFEKVRPYREIFPKELQEEISKFHLW